MKRHPFAEAADGAIGLETLLAAALRLYHNGEIGLLPLLRAMTINPAKLLGLPSGRLEKGAPADLILVDLGQPWVVDQDAAQGALQELALRREPDAGPRAHHHGCRQHRLPIRCRRARRDAAPSSRASAMGILFSAYAPLALLAGYLLGSIPFGLLLTQAAGLGDVRNIGSGNIGATNVLRTGRKGLAAATLLLDALKGTVAVLLVYEVRRALRGLRRLPALLRRRPRRLPRPPVPGLAALQGRQGRGDLHRRAVRRCIGRPALPVLPGVGGGGR